MIFPNLVIVADLKPRFELTLREPAKFVPVQRIKAPPNSRDFPLLSLFRHAFGL